MKTLWQEPARREVLARIERLTPDARAAWGRMSAPQMLAHVTDSLRMAFGDLPTAEKRVPIRHSPLKELIIYWLPFPKGTPTAPELLARVPSHWPDERDACGRLVERFATERLEREWPRHPAFGALSAKQWGVLAYRHTDHHLRQFGV